MAARGELPPRNLASLLIALQASARFIVVDRGGPGHNCDVVAIGDGCGVLLELPDAG